MEPPRTRRWRGGFSTASSSSSAAGWTTAAWKPPGCRRPADLRLRERTGCSVVAVVRGEEVLVELGEDFRFRPEDTVYVCGSTGAVRRFAAEVG